MRTIKSFLFLSVVVLSFSLISAGVINTGRITGKLMIKDGGAMAGGSAMFFNEKSGPPPSHDKYWRVPDVIAEIGEHGRFSVELPEGNYYMGALMRMGDRKIGGPPLDGDYLFMSRDKEGKQKLHYVKIGETVDLGAISGVVPFKRHDGKGITAIEGTISDVNGNRIEGAIVFAYVSVTQIGIPMFVSERTGKDGKYRLAVAEGGTYYLRVRDIYGGGPPIPGSIIGRYGEKGPVAVEVKTGEVTKGIDIKVIKVPGRGPIGREFKGIKNPE